MKSLMLCVMATLATAMAALGCADESSVPDESSVRGDGDPGAGDGPDGEDTTVSDAGEGPLLDAGNRPSPDCPAQARSTAASHIVLMVRWPAHLAITAGHGEVHLWTKADLVFERGRVTGTARPCGSVVPALTKAGIVGGGQVQLEFPGAVWESPAMPVFQVTGSFTGFRVGAALSMDPIASTVGLTMIDPLNDAWPGQASQITAVDHDGDGYPGIRAIPRTDPPFAAPPLDLGAVLDPSGAHADEVYLATRTVVQLTGTRASCASAAGTAQVSAFDSHVVGCHVQGGGACTQAQSDFLDASLPLFEVESATFEMVQVPSTATCAAVRAALPVR